jgi:hypothetical protein
MAAATATRSRRTCRCRGLPARNLPSAKSSPCWPDARDSHRAGSSHPAPSLNPGHLRPHGRRDGQHAASPATTCDAPTPTARAASGCCAADALQGRRLGVGDTRRPGTHRVGSPARTRWLFPGGMPGKPITASQLETRHKDLRTAMRYIKPGGEPSPRSPASSAHPAASTKTFPGLHRPGHAQTSDTREPTPRGAV